MFQPPSPLLMLQQQQQQPQFQGYQGPQAAPAPNPMAAQPVQQQNPLVTQLQQKGLQNLIGPNPMAPQAQNPMGPTRVMWDATVPGLNAVLPNTQAAADSPLAGNVPRAGAAHHDPRQPRPPRQQTPTVPNGPIPSGNLPKPFTPQPFVDNAPPQGIFPQWLKSALGIGGGGFGVSV